MRTLAAGLGGDTGIISGESGAAAFGAAGKIITDALFAEVKQAMGIDQNAVLLFINTEGDTDSENYRRIVTD